MGYNLTTWFNYIDHTDKTSLLCGLSHHSHVLKDKLYDWNNSVRKTYHTGDIDMVSPQNVSSDVLKDSHYVKKSCHTDCIDMVFPQCVFPYVAQDHFYVWKSYYTDYNDMVSPQSVFSSVL